MTSIKKRIIALFFAIIMIFYFVLGAYALECKLGGQPFGVRFYLDGAMVAGIDEVEGDNGMRSPASEAGIRVGDIIIKAQGEPVQSANTLAKLVADSNGMEIDLVIRRGQSEASVKLVPERSLSDGRYKAGLLLKDQTAGVGTVTYIISETGEFAGLGHGICDTKTGSLLPLYRGIVSDVGIIGIKRGERGAPGEIRANFTGQKTGTLLKNTELGVYGAFAVQVGDTKLQTATRAEIHDGKAKLYCTLDSSGVCGYDVIISGIERDSRTNKCFIVEVVDPALIEKTGGIVQGMSGSPIVQDNKLVGAVTHVLVDDPTRGYGIFIDNMLDKAS